MGIYFINSDVFQFKVSISRKQQIKNNISLKKVHLDALPFSSLFKIFTFFCSCVKAVNFTSTTCPTSLFLFPVTVAVRRLLVFACKKVNKRNSSICTWPARVFSASGHSCATYTLIALVSSSLASALLFSSQY